ncbi:MAG TPA: ABC transporter substrate-binding protein [Usitatibacteraceae bacterium]|nr:ABC transporter substrate-binding protein [Usitatibacteraceae bacterium]
MGPLIRLAGALALGIAVGAGSTAAAQAGPKKVLRYAFEIAETGFDPAQISDGYSSQIISLIFDTPLTYDYLARPLKLKPNLLEAMPEVSEGGTVFTLRFRKGILFADDPAFNGVPREVTAADFAYSLKRLYDPKNRSPNLYLVDGKIAGDQQLKKREKELGRFDYDLPVEGLQVVDRYTLRIRLNNPDYNFLYLLASTNVSCLMAREVIEKHVEDTQAHPVGTGPYRITYWKRGSRIILERNPRFREEFWAAEPPANDPGAQAIAAKMTGKRLPLIDRIEIAPVEETQPRWLAFLNAEHDYFDRVPPDFTYQAVSGNSIVPNLAKRGIQLDRVPGLEITYSYFAMEHPLVGGYTPDKVALRRAVVLGYNNNEEIQVIRKNQAIPAQSPVGPGAMGYRADFRTSANEYNPAKARALLDLYGYVDKDGDGYRDLPDGSPLVLEMSSTPTQLDRQYDEVWRKSMEAIGIRMNFRKAQWPDLLKDSRAGKLMMWRLAWLAGYPDGEAFYVMLYGPNGGQANHSRFKVAEFDRLFEKARTVPPGPERESIYREMNRIFLVNAPWKLGTHRIYNDLTHPWVIGYRRHPVLRTVWKYVDLDAAQQQAALAQ